MPGLHAVAEALVEGSWCVVDATALAPGDTLYDDPRVQFPPIPSFAPEHFSSLRATTAEQRARFFEPIDGGRLRVKAPWRADVRFGQLNLLDGVATSVLPRFDVIFCRNVVIYFDDATQERVWKRFIPLMTPGATLYIGHSERVSGPAAGGPDEGGR